MDTTPPVADLPAPPLLYGTAWKEERTEALTRLALQTGFRAIDTANQRRHYFEAGVGAALRSAIRDRVVQRKDVFLQTKFTDVRGQDSRLPYDPRAPHSEQVAQSFQSSLVNLGVDHIDSFILHGPSQARGLGASDREVWRAMESLHTAGLTRYLGVSNVSLEQLQLLCRHAHVRPSFVQNRTYAIDGWDRAIRDFCLREGIVYQGFSLLTANASALRSAAIKKIAAEHGRTVPQIIFRFARQIGMLPLTGTTDLAHMREDLASLDLVLSDDETHTIETIAG